MQNNAICGTNTAKLYHLVQLNLQASQRCRCSALISWMLLTRYLKDRRTSSSRESVSELSSLVRRYRWWHQKLADYFQYSDDYERKTQVRCIRFFLFVLLFTDTQYTIYSVLISHSYVSYYVKPITEIPCMAKDC